MRGICSGRTQGDLLIDAADRLYFEAELFRGSQLSRGDFNNNPCASPSGRGWRAELQPSNHPVSDFHFDVVIGADGRKNTLDGETQTQKCRDGVGGPNFGGRYHLKTERNVDGTIDVAGSCHIYFS